MPPAAENQGRASASPTNRDALVSVACILPADVQVAERFLEQTTEVLRAHYNFFEILLIDNGLPVELHLRFQSLEHRIPNIRLVRLTRRYSMEVALAAALDHCIGDYVVLIDPVHHPPALIPQLVQRASEGSDSVAAIAVRQENLIDRLITRRIYRVASHVLGFPLLPTESYYTVFSRRLVNSIVRIRSKNRYLSYLNASVGLQQGTILFESSSPRPTSARRLITAVVTASSILVSNTATPLRFASMLGLMASAANLLYLFYIFAVTLVKSRIAEGWLTTSLTQTAMFLVLFLIMSILSEYIARILDETKEQPLYFVESESSSTVSETDRDRLNVIRHTEDAPSAGAARAGA
jgi:polyisoprenyl-phosphate glycosyltransferase